MIALSTAIGTSVVSGEGQGANDCAGSSLGPFTHPRIFKPADLSSQDSTSLLRPEASGAEKLLFSPLNTCSPSCWDRVWKS